MSPAPKATDPKATDPKATDPKATDPKATDGVGSKSSPGITIDFSSGVPLYQQIADEVRNLVAQEQLEEGSELPSVRKLGAMLGVNLNTVAKAYRALAAENLIELRHGSRARVLGRSGHGAQKSVAEDTEINRRLHDLIGRLRLGGASRAQVETLFERAVAHYFPSGDTS